ncbi:MAG: hypothetical protein E3K37_02435 [Candidatus Kuenenia sp.]|nr:hypothetical protein [Candidatus Kuenenia hertensis]
MHIDTPTFQTAQRVFESRYGSLAHLGLSKNGMKKLFLYGKKPKTEDVASIVLQFKEILVEVMKPHAKKSKHSQNPRKGTVVS